MRSSSLALLSLALAGGFLYGLWELYHLRFEAGDIYPPYSSLRADPLGAKAFYESVGQLPGMSAERNYRPIASLKKTPATVLFLGQDPFVFGIATEEALKEYEALAAGGAHVIVAMRPVRRLVDTNKSAPVAKPPPRGSTPLEPLPIQKRWGVSFDYLRQSAKQAGEESGAEPKVTALYFRSGGQVLHEVERAFGPGSVTLLANCYPFSNESLAGERDVQLLTRVLADRPLVIFDESHFGLTENGSVGALVRKYHLEGAVAVLAVLLALFIWKNSASFLPPRKPPAAGVSIEAKNAGAGLANLLRRNIPPKTLLNTCWNEWERSRYGGRHYPRSRIERARAVTAEVRDAAESYREVTRILAEKN